jgi:hypothetical protein
MTSEGAKDIKIPHLYIYSDAATSCKESIRLESRKRQDLIHRIQREEKTMTKEEALSLEKILTKIDRADEMNCKKEEEYNSFCTNTREDWNEEQYQKLKREKILTEAAYLASLVELKAEVKNMLNQ